ncbi:ABC transporter permease [Halalkalibacter okhensis]|uniref:Transport permease protein n=1 Tax=Halalkalibacter okhensis TaxID=333138 RepID=A0A0B0ICU1_9BACI|nr:ABC transporter permease [Halalkalibacter okhensis]KHF38717.1 ABC transporter permease [Halalkalibacter okhensis]
MWNALCKLWKNKDLVLTLTKREINSQYKQSFLGKLWIVFQPLGLVAVYTIVFSLFVRLPSEGVPYALFFIVALLPWRFFNSTIGSSPRIVTGYSGLVRQRRFYRPALVFVKLISETVSFTYSLISLVILMVYFMFFPGANIFYVIPIFFIQLILSIGLMFLLSSLNVYVRDVNLMTPIIMRMWFYLTPIIYSYQSVPIQFQPLLALNPLTGIIDGYRRVIIHNQVPDFYMLSYGLIFGLTFLAIGWVTFLKLEKNFADVV